MCPFVTLDKDKRPVSAVNDFDVIVALWARSLMWQKQILQHSEAVKQHTHSKDALQIARRLFLLSHPTDDDIVFM